MIRVEIGLDGKGDEQYLRKRLHAEGKTIAGYLRALITADIKLAKQEEADAKNQLPTD